MKIIENKSSLQLRAKILAKIRQFFAERNVLEVETPLLCSTTATDPHIHSFSVASKRYLQTSPEFCMKRLLAAGSGSIYQICKAFRREEVGRQHNPEFTLLEWYRIGFDHQQLMIEVDELLQTILQASSAEKITYGKLFEKYLQINPHKVSVQELKNCAQKMQLKLSNENITDRDAWLQLLMTHFIEPQLGNEKPLFIYDFPATQAALSKIRHEEIPVAERFEVYVNGIELANGYHELIDAKEQQARFIADQKRRQELGYENVPIDKYLLAALEESFPNCAGVALGVDRLIMLAGKSHSIHSTLSFSWEDV